MQDVNTIRATNNAIFNDIFWVHLAYVTADDGIARLRTLLRSEPHYGPVLAGFEAIDQGRRVSENGTASADARLTAEGLIWHGNVQLLEHEQRTLVQPNFDGLSCAFARLISIGSATSFEVHGLRREAAYFTSFYLYSATRGLSHNLRAQPWPRITRYDDRWGWLVTSVVPRFRRLDAHTVPDRREHATHPRRSARLRVDPVRAAASPADGEAAPNDAFPRRLRD